MSLDPRNTKAYAAYESDTPLKHFEFQRRAVGPKDVGIEILYCGVCHSDLHQARNDWHGSTYPLVPGHEIVGKVTAVGNSVSKYKAGDIVAVGCMVDSCQTCPSCKSHEEQFCENGTTWTYNTPDKISGGMTYGGYSNYIVTNQNFVLNIPDGMDLAKVAPILCAGITTYSPLKQWNIQKGMNVGVVGVGGLGHMAVKLAAAIGAEVTVFTRSEAKKKEAFDLGASKVVLSGNDSEMEASMSTQDFVINTVPVAHDISPYVKTLKQDSTMVIVGAIDNIPPFHSGLLLRGRRRVSASLIGGIADTQEVIDFCHKHDVYPECEMIKMDEINSAYDRLIKGDVHYRFVIDMSSL